MWLFTRYGFYSIACASKPDGAPDPEVMMIRARRCDHLTNLQKRFPEIAEAQVVTLPHRDYRYRLLVPKQQWLPVLSELAQEQTWSNFKNEVAQFQGRAGTDYVQALHSVWGIMNELQDSEPQR